ncbi:MAG: flagellar basal-body rod protein FlgF [Lachnospiraceae bacterium]|nr:flagellar basal-body rod protein FlgF [Lachnospiraceae bacterium]
MVKGLYTAYTGMINEQHRMDVLTNNLANASTVGYKKEGATSQAFDEVLALKIKDTTDPAKVKPLGGISLGVKIGENYTDYSQGSLRETGNTYDIAISGTGFFSVEFRNKAGQTSTKYTRDGNFTLNKEGYLVTKDGDFVLGKNGRIKLDPLQTSVIDKNGNIYQNDTLVATLDITDFEDYNYLEHYGENYYQTVEGAREKNGEYQTISGYLEMSNMSVVQEMVNMISVSRAYETNQKIVQTYDSTLEIAANQLGKI